MGYMGNQYLKTQDKKALGPVSGQAFCALIIIQMETLLYLGTHNTHHGVKETVILGLTKGTSVGSDAWLQS